MITHHETEHRVPYHEDHHALGFTHHDDHHGYRQDYRLLTHYDGHDAHHAYRHHEYEMPHHESAWYAHAHEADLHRDEHHESLADLDDEETPDGFLVTGAPPEAAPPASSMGGGATDGAGPSAGSKRPLDAEGGGNPGKRPAAAPLDDDIQIVE